MLFGRIHLAGAIVFAATPIHSASVECAQVTLADLEIWGKDAAAEAENGCQK